MNVTKTANATPFVLDKIMNNYIKTGICSLLLGLSGGIAWQFEFVAIGFVLIFFMVLALVCGPDVFE
jgi:hypothetical protein